MTASTAVSTVAWAVIITTSVGTSWDFSSLSTSIPDTCGMRMSSTVTSGLQPSATLTASRLSDRVRSSQLWVSRIFFQA